MTAEPGIGGSGSGQRIDSSLPPQDRYNLLRSRVSDLSNQLAQPKEAGSKPDYKLVLAEGERLSGEFNSIVDAIAPTDTRGTRDWQKINSRFPQRGQEINFPLTDVLYEAYSNIPFAELTEQQREDYMRKIFTKTGIMYSGHSGGTYQFGFGSPDTEGNRLAQQIVDKPINFKSLDEEEEEKIAALMEHEREVFKVHVAVPAGRKQDVLGVIVQEKEGERRIAGEIIDEKRAKRESVFASEKEIAARKGSETLGLGNWKMADVRTSELHPDYPTFVFYVRQASDSQDHRDQIIRGMAKVLKPLELPEAVVVPRYNTQASVDGKPIPGLYWAQGDGDIKKELERQGGKELLGRYFDAAVNYARVNDTEEGERSKLTTEAVAAYTGISSVDAAHVLNSLRNVEPVIALTILSSQKNVPAEFVKTHDLIQEMWDVLKGKWQYGRNNDSEREGIVLGKYGEKITSGDVTVFLTSLLNTAINGSRDVDVRRHLRRSWEKVSRVPGMPDSLKIGAIK